MKVTRIIDKGDLESIDAKEVLKKIVDAYDDSEGTAQDFALDICEILESTFGVIEDFE